MASVYDNYPAQRYVDEYEKDESEECKRCKGNCKYIGMTGEWACQGFVPMTREDMLRKMTAEALARFLYEGPGLNTLYIWLREGEE